MPSLSRQKRLRVISHLESAILHIKEAREIGLDDDNSAGARTAQLALVKIIIQLFNHQQDERGTKKPK